MAEPRFSRAAVSLARRTYTLRPARSPGLRVAVWVVVCVFSAAAGVAATVAWRMQRGAAQAEQCTAEPVSEDSEQAELARTRLALAQESVARDAVQKTADSAAAEVARLTAELQFLRGQRNTRPPAQAAQAAPPRR
ncbi:hypothetical protein [Paraburkholderia sp. SIMBA_030]|uniref:hypothetical protein n=1 Tax=Paraburkholderia sp. SIMBA_030 TaxID=3085773 RepID=UPI00397D8111